MIHRILIVIFLVLNWASLLAQDKSDVNRIVLSTYVPQQSIQLSEQTKSLLNSKLNQIVTQNGVGGANHNGRFVLMAQITESTKDLIPGPPQMTALTIQLELLIVDAVEQRRFNSIILDLKGVGEGTNENKALMDAIKKLNPKKEEIVGFIAASKEKIIVYYNTQCDYIIREAISKSEQENYDEAMRILSEIPDVCEDCFTKSAEFINVVYQKKVDKECLIKMKQAKSAWLSDMSPKGAKASAEILNALSPFASCNEDAEKFIAEIQNKLEKAERDRFNLELKKYNDAVSLKKEALRIDEENKKRQSQLIEDKQKQDYQLQKDRQRQNYEVAKKDQEQDGFKGVINSIVKLKTQLWSDGSSGYVQQKQIDYSTVKIN
jgi:hypothetical protein